VRKHPQPLGLKGDKDQNERDHRRGQCGKDNVSPKNQGHQSEEGEQNNARYSANPHHRRRFHSSLVMAHLTFVVIPIHFT
jgi:hypothetical protein